MEYVYIQLPNEDYWQEQARLWEGRCWTLHRAMEEIREALKKANLTLGRDWDWGDE